MTKEAFRIPRGAKFDIGRNEWYIEQPTEPRPFFEEMKRTGRTDFGVVMGSENDAYIWIMASHSLDIGAEVCVERITYAEYASLVGSEAKVDIEPDHYVSGAGPMFGATGVVPREAQLRPSERGLVLMAGIEESVGGELVGVAGVNATELRSALFLWDKLDWPQSSLIDVPVSAEAANLIEAGIMSRTKIHSMGNLHSKKDLVNLHESAFRELERIEPGRWSVGHGISADPPEEGDPTRRLLVALYDVIAVPDVNVPLDEVLAFREKRRAELLALRSYLDDLYAAIRLAPNDAFAIVAANDKLSAAVSAQRKLMQEQGWLQKLTGLAVDVSFTDWATAGTAASAMFSATNNIIAAGHAGVLGLGVKVAAKRGKATPTSPDLRYLISIDRTYGGRISTPV